MEPVFKGDAMKRLLKPRILKESGVLYYWVVEIKYQDDFKMKGGHHA